MKITSRNQDIVARHVAGETLSAIGKSLNISRARAHKIFKDHATEADRASRDRPKPEPEPGPVDPDFPKNENRVRIHVPFAKSTEINQKQVRAGIRRWLAGEFPVTEIPTGNRDRMDVVIASGMHVRLCVRCSELNIPIATVVRGIIAYLENENAQSN